MDYDKRLKETQNAKINKKAELSQRPPRDALNIRRLPNSPNPNSPNPNSPNVYMLGLGIGLGSGLGLGIGLGMGLGIGCWDSASWDSASWAGTQYMGALKNFQSPDYARRPRLLFLKFVMGVCSDRY